jgi:hypothetical protein
MTTIGNDVPDFTAALSGFVGLSSTTFSIFLPSVPSISFFSALFMLLFPFFLSGARILGDYLLDEITWSVSPSAKISRTFEKVSLNMTSDSLTKMC